MKVFLKFILTIIFIASLVGCIFFGYHYLKGSPDENKLTLSTAEELTYTVFYDLGLIDAQAFNTAIGKDPIVRPTNFMKDVENTCEGTYFQTEPTEEYKTYADNTIYIVGSNNYLYEGSAFGAVFSPHFGYQHKGMFELFANDAEEKVWYLLEDEEWGLFKICYEIKDSKLIFRVCSSTTEYYFEFELLNKNSDGITEYKFSIRSFYGNINSDNYCTAISTIDVAYSNNKKVVNRFTNSVGGEYAWNKSYDCDIVNNKILYTMNSAIIEEKIKANVSPYCHDNIEPYFNSINAVDLPQA